MINTAKTFVIYSGNPINAEAVSMLLNEHGIINFLNNRLLGNIAPWQVSSGGFAPVEVIINETDKEEARKLLEEFHPIC
ncbi:DUF2007 domain-containing protein [Sunxiuqinia elliptica]